MMFEWKKIALFLTSFLVMGGVFALEKEIICSPVTLCRGTISVEIGIPIRPGPDGKPKEGKPFIDICDIETASCLRFMGGGSWGDRGAATINLWQITEAVGFGRGFIRHNPGDAPVQSILAMDSDGTILVWTAPWESNPKEPIKYPAGHIFPRLEKIPQVSTRILTIGISDADWSGPYQPW